MKIRTLENLNQRLTDDLIWRKIEIVDLKRLGERLEYLSLDRDGYQQLHEQILEMMEYFRNQIENHAAQQLYLRNH